MNIIAIAKRFSQLPSSVINVEDEYTAFCFNEACMLIMSEIESGKEPIWIEDRTKENEKPKEYNSMEDFYKDIGVEQ